MINQEANLGSSNKLFTSEGQTFTNADQTVHDPMHSLGTKILSQTVATLARLEQVSVIGIHRH